MDHGLVVGVLLVGCALLAWHWRPAAVTRRRRRAALLAWQRDRALADSWVRLHETCRTSPGFRIAQVSQVYATYPRRGTKAYITWWGTRDWQDTWFEQAWPPQGSWVVLSGGTGYGPHNREPRVFYVRQIHAIAPAAAPQAWQRCEDAGWVAPAA